MFVKKAAAAALLVCAVATVPGCAAESTELHGGASATALDSAAAARRIIEGVDLDYQMFTLENGMTVLVYPDHSVPKVYIGVWYDVGSKDEPEGKTGFAHLFEHLMFQGTANRDTEYFEEMSAIGASGLNGTTNFDRTNYFQTVPTAALDRALWLQSDRMIHLLGGITQEVFDNQRDVVKNEKRQGELRPGAAADDVILEHFYPAGHPYAHSTIGSMEDLDSATLEDVQQWFNDYYGGLNSYLVLAGDIDVETARAKAQQYFGALPGGTPINTVEQWVPGRDEVQIDVFYDKVGAPSFERKWGLPNNDSRETVLMGVVAQSLTDSRTAPLTQRLVHDTQLATQVSASVSPGEVSSEFNIRVQLQPGASIEEVGRIVDEELAKYFESGPDAERLASINLNYSAGMIRGLESSEGIGSLLIQNELYHGDPEHFLEELGWMADATPAELAALARKWLDAPYYESRMLPAPPTTQTADVDRTSMPDTAPFEGDVEFPKISQTTLSNGMTLVVAERHQIPVVDVAMVFDTGSLLDDQYSRGVAAQAFGLMTQGTERYTAEELSDAVERIAMGGLGASAGEQESTVGWGALAEYLDEATAIAAEVVRHPTYPQEEIDKIVGRIDGQYDAIEANPLQAAPNAVFGRALWGADHRRGHIPTRDEAKQFSRDLIVAFHDHEIGPNNATVYMIGDISLDEGAALIERHFGDWRSVDATSLAESAPAAGEPGRVVLVDAPGAPQTSITAGHIVGPYDPQNGAVESLMNAAIGAGFNSRLNMNLREDKGWAYGFRAGTTRSPVGQRVYFAGGTVQTDKTAESMAEIQRELEEYVGSRPITEAELERDQQAFVRSYATDFDSSRAFMGAMISSATYGLPLDYAADGASRLEAVTRNQAEAYAREIIHPDELTWVVVGDLSQIEESVRALNYGPVEVWDVYGNRVR